MVTYTPLWKLLIDKKMRKGELCEVASVSRATLAKMTHDEYVALAVIDRICVSLDCQPNDVFQVIREPFHE